MVAMVTLGRTLILSATTLILFSQPGTAGPLDGFGPGADFNGTDPGLRPVTVVAPLPMDLEICIQPRTDSEPNGQPICIGAGTCYGPIFGGATIRYRDTNGYYVEVGYEYGGYAGSYNPCPPP